MRLPEMLRRRQVPLLRRCIAATLIVTDGGSGPVALDLGNDFGFDKMI